MSHVRRAPIYTDAASCQDCYRCVAVCPSAAICVRGGLAQVKEASCLACGLCVQACPKGYQRIRSDADRVRKLLQQGEKVVVSLSSTWASEFPEASLGAVVALLRALGFRSVSETAHGASAFMEAVASHVAAAAPRVMLMPACPAVTELVLRELPQWADHLIPVASPVLAHARQLKAAYGADVKVVSIGPCAADKLQADANPDLLEAALTFGELHGWMLDRGVYPSQFPDAPADLLLGEAACGHEYAVRGSMTDLLRAQLPRELEAELFYYSGVQNIRDALYGLETWGEKGRVILEFMMCRGGCVNGPGGSQHRSLTIRQMDIVRRCGGEGKQDLPSAAPQPLGPIDLRWAYHAKADSHCQVLSPLEISRHLLLVGRHASSGAMDCGCCGYSSCRAFGIALARRQAEPSMCVSYMREVGEGKFNVLFNHMPSAVVVVDGAMRIVEANWNMAHLLGATAELAYDKQPGLGGLAAQEYLPFHRLFASVLRTGEPIVARDERVGSTLLRISVFPLESRQLAIAIARNMFAADVRGDEIVRRTNALIARNLATVQQIAYLLGENASVTESELHAIVEAFDHAE